MMSKLKNLFQNHQKKDDASYQPKVPTRHLTKIGFWTNGVWDSTLAKEANSIVDKREELAVCESKLQELSGADNNDENEKKKNEEELMTLHEKIAVLALDLGDFDRAERALKEKLNIAKLVYPDPHEHEVVATAMQQLGDVQSDACRGANPEKAEINKAAMDNFFGALDLRQNMYGNNNLKVAETFFSMAWTLLLVHEPSKPSAEQAVDCFEEALEIRKEHNGNDDLSVADALVGMGAGKILQSTIATKTTSAESEETPNELLDQALKHLWEARRIYMLPQNDNNNDGAFINTKVSHTLCWMGQARLWKAEYELAYECHNECIGILQRVAEESQPVQEELANMNMSLGELYSNWYFQKSSCSESSSESSELNRQKAMDYYQNALSIRRKVFPDGHARLADSFMALAHFHAKLGNKDDAESFSKLCESMQAAE